MNRDQYRGLDGLAIAGRRFHPGIEQGIDDGVLDCGMVRLEHGEIGEQAGGRNPRAHEDGTDVATAFQAFWIGNLETPGQAWGRIVLPARVMRGRRNPWQAGPLAGIRHG